MNLHEYQSKQLFAPYAIPIPKGAAVDSLGEAVAVAWRPGGSLWVVKTAMPPGKRMGHVGALVAGGQRTAIAKVAALGDQFV